MTLTDTKSAKCAGTAPAYTGSESPGGLQATTSLDPFAASGRYSTPEYSATTVPPYAPSTASAVDSTMSTQAVHGSLTPSEAASDAAAHYPAASAVTNMSTQAARGTAASSQAPLYPDVSPPVPVAAPGGAIDASAQDFEKLVAGSSLGAEAETDLSKEFDAKVAGKLPLV